MKKYLLAAEAVNLNHFIYDIHQISAIRGGSFLLLDAVEQLHKNKNLTNLTPIFTGASSGVYSFQAADDVPAQEVVKVARNALNEATGNYSTFVVDFILYDAAADFASNYLKLMTKLRVQQFQQPTLRLPNHSAAAGQACTLDGTRPAVDTTSIHNENISESVAYRVNKGRDLRHSIVGRIIGNAPGKNPSFTNDLEELSICRDAGYLSGKIALIYIDGNRFGSIRKLCKSENDIKIFSGDYRTDDGLKGLQSAFLKQLIDKAKGTQDFILLRKDKDKEVKAIRLEILLWGGDEIKLVVPAWKGWKVLNDFYDCMANANFNLNELTHAAGIVFCHHNAPILEIDRLAHDLAEHVKENLPRDPAQLKHINHDTMRYLVLESFDGCGGSLTGFIKRYYGNRSDNLIMTATEMKRLQETIALMKKQAFPRRQLFRIVQKLRAADGIVNEDLQRELDAIIEAGCGALDISVADKVKENLRSLGCMAPVQKDGDPFQQASKPQRYYALTELWDYV